jgi:hypothetical protein
MTNHSPIEYLDYQKLLGKSNSESDWLQKRADKKGADSKLEDISEQENEDGNE